MVESVVESVWCGGECVVWWRVCGVVERALPVRWASDFSGASLVSPYPSGVAGTTSQMGIGFSGMPCRFQRFVKHCGWPS